jgi:hypothetical protein
MRILIRHPGVGKLAREVQLSVEPVDNLLDDGDRSRREVKFRGRTKPNHCFQNKSGLKYAPFSALHAAFWG